MTNTLSAETPKTTFGAKILKYIGFNQRYFWTSFWFILVFVVLIIPIFCASHLNMIYFSSGFLWASAYFMAGSLFGFIFGVPTIITQGPGASTTDPVAQQSIDSTKKAQKIVQANTNLTQISDWLTKVIVGAGLVELTKIPGVIEKAAQKMAPGLAMSDTNLAFATVFSGGILVVFLTYGFVFGYLTMRIILTEIFAE